jgi:hypothetical protein
MHSSDQTAGEDNRIRSHAQDTSGLKCSVFLSGICGLLLISILLPKCPCPHHWEGQTWRESVTEAHCSQQSSGMTAKSPSG